MPFVTKDWQNGREGGTRINAESLEDMEARLAAYTDAQAGGGLDVVVTGTVTLNQTLDMTNRTECLWVVTLGGNLKLEIVGWSAGDSVTLVVKQDAVGNREVLDLPTALWDDGAIPGGSALPNAVDIRGFFSDGVSVYGFDSGTGMA